MWRFIALAFLAALASCDCLQVADGRVVDKASGKPLANATVLNKLKPWSKTRTDTLGYFHLTSVSGGFSCPPITVLVQKENYQSREATHTGGTQTIELEPTNSFTSSDTAFFATTKELRSNRIPNRVFLMPNLRYLAIQGMDCDYGNGTTCWMIAEIPPSVAKLQNLRTLRLPVNAITKIPPQLTQLTKLQVLDLTDNSGLSDIDAVTSLVSLEQLYLFGCGLAKLPQHIGNLSKLKRLGLTGNAIDLTELNRIKSALPKCEVIFSP